MSNLRRIVRPAVLAIGSALLLSACDVPVEPAPVSSTDQFVHSALGAYGVVAAAPATGLALQTRPAAAVVTRAPEPRCVMPLRTASGDASALGSPVSVRCPADQAPSA